MQLKRTTLLVFLILLIPISGCANAGKIPYPPEKIVVMGDSITWGYYNNTRITPYPLYLAAKFPVGMEVINKGFGGNQTSQMLLRFQKDVVNRNPGYIIIQGGSNDIRKGVSLKETEWNLKSMYQLARYNNITPIATTLYFDNTFNKSQTENVIALNTWIKIYSWKNRNPVVDFNKRFADKSTPGKSNPALLSNDSMHPNPAGQRALANVIYDKVFAVNVSPEK